MSFYRFSAKVIKRSNGSSSVASAAYRAGIEIVDEKTGKAHDHSYRDGVVHSEILSPNNAPQWVQDRKRLWNEVEKSLQKFKRLL